MRIAARRQFVFLAGALIANPRSVLGQESMRVVRIGWLGNSKLDTPETIAPWEAFRLELHRLGREEGRNLQIEKRFALGNTNLYAQFVREMIQAKVDLIVSTTGPGTRAAKSATGTIPIVFANVPFPVELGIVASLGRPGGNVTGFSTGDLELIGKRLQLLRETFPRIRRVAYLPSGLGQIDDPVHLAAAKLGLQIQQTIEAERAEDFPAAFASGANADAWFVAERFQYFANRKAIIQMVSKQHKPAIYPSTFFVEAGGLMSYSADQRDLMRRVAGYVDRILRGAKPEELPVEQPVKYELAINLKSANVSGLRVPNSILARADRVIE